MGEMLKVLYTAAHGGYGQVAAPLGGGAAICEQLCAEWRNTQPFELKLLTPALLGRETPSAHDLVRFNEREYAAFCYAFSDAVTREILRHDPGDSIVLSNDISEGPDFRRLHEAGFALYAIYHVDVVAYIAAIYARGVIHPASLVRWHKWLAASPFRGFLPRIADLIFGRQRQTVQYCRGLIVPSPAMKELLLVCYPELAPERVHVIPWGAPPAEFDEDAVEGAAQSLRARWGVPDDALVLLTLSRLSPEKGQDLLLEALLEWEREGGPPQAVWVFLCGGAAYMMGQAFERKLRRLSSRLRRVRVVFPGHVTGLEKQAYFRMADLYVFPSRHESYGLTLMEALAAGLPALCLDHHGARSIMNPDLGACVPRRELLPALKQMLAEPQTLKRQSENARRFAASRPFSASAAALARILSGGAEFPPASASSLGTTPPLRTPVPRS